MLPTASEAEAEWFTRSQEFFKWYTPRSPPLAKGGPWEQYFQKVDEKKARNKSVRETSPGESRSKDLEYVSLLEYLSLEQRVKDLEFRTLKLETVVQIIEVSLL